MKNEIGKLGDLRLIATNHCMKRFNQREIKPEEVLYVLYGRQKEIRLYYNMGALAYLSERLSFVFKVEKGHIVIITALNKYADVDEKEVMIIWPNNLSKQEGGRYYARNY